MNGDRIATAQDCIKILHHEYTHSVTHKLWDEVQQVAATLNDDDIVVAGANILPNYYRNHSPLQMLNEIISTFVENIPRRVMLDVFNGRMPIEGVISIFEGNIYDNEATEKVAKAILPVVAHNIEIQKQRYGERKENPFVIGREYFSEDSGIKERERDEWFGGRSDISRGYRPSEAESRVYEAGRGGEGSQKEVDARYSIQAPEGVIADPRATEDTIRIYMRRGHQVAKDNIRKKYKAYRDAAKSDYAEKRRVRLDKIKTLRTNSAKVDYIFGDIDEYSTPYVHQAFAKIARGEVRIVWDNSPDGKKRGIASETDAKSGEKRLYASITNGATLYFDEYVHQWWQELNGYENNIDTQELRDALIKALSEVCNANGAISKLREIYDNEHQTLDETLDIYEREEEREIAEETARYEQEVADTTGWVRLANGVIVFDGLCNKIELFKHIEQLFVSLRSCSLYHQASRLDFYVLPEEDAVASLPVQRRAIYNLCRNRSPCRS